MEMAVDVLNLFLIKEKALACVRDELLEREPGRRSQREAPAQQGGGCVPLSDCPSPTPTCLPQAETLQPLAPASPSQFQQMVPSPLSASPLGLLQGLSQFGGLGKQPPLLPSVLSSLQSTLDHCESRWPAVNA